jgi:predicted HicB family RNase H-like nuclease
MGRPPLEEEQKMRNVVQVRLTDEDHERVEELAEHEKISISEWGRQAVHEKLARSKRRRRSTSAAAGPA